MATPSFEIPVWLGTRGPTKWVSGVDAATTCGDVADRLVAALDLTGADCAFVLAEQWRGVERPLGADTRLLRVWQAWGDEQQHVRLVLRRVRAKAKPDNEEARALATASRRRRRRRHSGSSQASSCSGRPGDTPHPRAAEATGDKHIESMMRVILKQGRIICNELMRMERDEDAEDEDEDEEALRRRKSEPGLGPETSPAETEALVADLLRLHALNQELQAMETRAHLLSANLQQLQPARPPEGDSDGVESRVATMRALNASAGEDVDRQQKQLADLNESLSARRASARQLEYDVNVVEKEGRRLHRELEKVMSIRIPEMGDADDDQGDVLRESQVIYGELKQLQQATATASNQLSSGRTLITASPESSSSGVSSGSEAPSGEAHPTSFAPIRRCADEAAESNSDTGLGSLHSSTAGSADELETLV